MTKANNNRKVNKRVFYSKMALIGLSLNSLGKILDPPVSKVRVFHIINQGKPDYRLKEISTILKSNIQTLFPKQEAPHVR